MLDEPGDTTTRRPGRPTLGPRARDRVLSVRGTDAEHETWTEAAGEQPVSAWARERLNDAASRDPAE